MFRASSDGGVTFGDKINLSNTTDTDSWRVEIAGEDETVVVHGGRQTIQVIHQQQE
jgi:hypothetical protein